MLTGSLSAFATTIAQETWYDFQFGNVGSIATGQFAGAGYSDPGAIPWSFVAPSQGATFVVTDANLPGDVFDVLDNGVLVGTTSMISPDPNYSCGGSPDGCLADSRMSHGTFFLTTGPHDITIRTAVSPFGGGSQAFFEVRPASAPEPHTSSMLIVGLFTGIGWTILRSRYPWPKESNGKSNADARRGLPSQTQRLTS